MTVQVTDNLAAVQINRESTGPAEIWYAADGRVLRRFGNFAALTRVRSGPRPAPETQLSRAAEKDPSTPNPMWVTPAVGGPQTKFAIHFRVLLNAADYRYSFTGTRCAGFTFPGGTGSPEAVRGQLWSDGVSAVHGQQLCRGTYRAVSPDDSLGDGP